MEIVHDYQECRKEKPDVFMTLYIGSTASESEENDMVTITSFWWLILVLPLLIFGITFCFFPQKVIRLQAMMQKNMFAMFGMSDDAIDRSIYSNIYGEPYSERLKRQQEQPEDFHFMMTWSRVMGCMVLIMVFASLCLVVYAALTGNLIIR